MSRPEVVPQCGFVHQSDRVLYTVSSHSVHVHRLQALLARSSYNLLSYMCRVVVTLQVEFNPIIVRLSPALHFHEEIATSRGALRAILSQ